MKRLLLLSTALLLLPAFGFAQEDRGEEVAVLRAVNQNNGTNQVIGFDGAQKETKGHPFLTDGWTDGWVLSANGKKYVNVSLRFDIVNDVVYYKNTRNEVIELDKAQIVQFSLANTSGSPFEFKKITNGEKSYFAQILYEDGLTQLHFRYAKKFYRGAKSNDGYSINSPDRYEPSNEMWITVKGKASKVKKSAGAVAAVFGTEKKQIKAYINKNELDMSDTADIVRVLEYYKTIAPAN